MTSASAPGKVILFGEHAVVSGAAALGGAVDLRAKVTVEDLPGSLTISADDLILRGFSLDLVSGRIASAEALNAVRYVRAALQEFEARDLRVKIESEIPLAAGMGSSAAIVVATVAALNMHLGLALGTKDIAQISHMIEKKVQQGYGSPMDTALATFGGYLLVSTSVMPIDLPALDIVVGYTGIPHDTRSEVEKVQSLLARYPDIVAPIFQAIGSISARSVPLIRDRKLLELGELMNVNHGLLEAVGVGSRELSELVYAARGAGNAIGAKLTGAGGGGCMIALPGPAGAEALMVALRQAKGLAYSVKTGCEGMRMEVGK
ncbi:Mevalonate kinase [uncultured archaeon]|nr:Mevalonate kinase [uncultured archaeon]